jgi:hemerythrin
MNQTIFRENTMKQRSTTDRRSAGTAGDRADAVTTSDTSHAYRSFMPDQFIKLLGKTSISDIKLGDNVETHMTILFSDIRDFTSLSESMTPQETFKFINSYFQEMEPALFESHGFVDKYMGDAIMALFPASADDALCAALNMLRRLRKFNAARRRSGAPAISIGIGLNTGFAIVGVMGGQHQIETTVISDAVNLASRLESLTKTYGVPLLISEHVLYSLEKPELHDIRFVDRVRVKGKEQPQSVYEVFDADAPALLLAKRLTKPIFEEALACYHFGDVAKALRLLRRCLAACPEDRLAQVYVERCKRFAKGEIHEGTGEIGMPLAWGEQYRINDTVIDRQHRALFAQVNKFVRDISRVRTGKPVEQIVTFLRKYVTEHFETEELIMRANKYPLLELQQQQHARFTRDFSFLEAELREKLATQRAFMLFKVQLLLVDWIANHTMKLDRHFGKYLKRS